MVPEMTDKPVSERAIDVIVNLQKDAADMAINEPYLKRPTVSELRKAALDAMRAIATRDKEYERAFRLAASERFINNLADRLEEAETRLKTEIMMREGQRVDRRLRKEAEGACEEAERKVKRIMAGLRATGMCGSNHPCCAAVAAALRGGDRE